MFMNLPHLILLGSHLHALIYPYKKSWFNESQFKEIPQFSEQITAPLNYSTIVNSI